MLPLASLLLLVGCLAPQTAPGPDPEPAAVRVGSPSKWFGYAAVWLGDVDGDGWHDFAVPDPRLELERVDGRSTGLVLVVSGGDGRVLADLRPRVGEAWFGFGLAAVDDLDEDRIGEVVVWGQRADGQPGFLRCMSPADGEVHWEQGAGPAFGFSVGVEALGDLDGDGVRDLAAWGVDSEPAREGTSRQVLMVLSGVDGSVLAQRVFERRDWLNLSAVRGIEDVDQDGRSDLVVLANSSARGEGARRRLMLVSSATCDEVAELSAPLELGGQLETADLDGDGRPEVLVSTRGNAPSPSDDALPAPGSLLVLDVESRGLRRSLQPQGSRQDARDVTSFDALTGAGDARLIVGSAEAFDEEVSCIDVESGRRLWDFGIEDSDEGLLPHLGSHVAVDPAPDAEARRSALTGTGNPFGGGPWEVWCFDPLTGQVRLRVEARALLGQAGL